MIDFDKPFVEQKPQLKKLILSLVAGDTTALELWLDSGDITKQGLDFKITAQCEHLVFDGEEKIRLIWLLWAYFFPEVVRDVRELNPTKWRQLGGWFELNPWYVIPPKFFHLPLGAKAQLSVYHVEIAAQKDAEYQQAKQARLNKRLKTDLDIGSDDEFEFID